MNRKNVAGFTLIEVMVTVAIVGILASIAYPTYLSQIRKSRRAEAQTTLMNIAARQQQMVLDTRQYADTTAALNVSVPSTVALNYTISISVGSATVPTFNALATPLGAQAADSCGTLSVDQAGIKSPPSCW